MMATALGLSVPYSSAFENYPLVERMLRVRKNRIAAYGVAISAVAVATALRQTFGGQVVEGLPFITYFPAIVIAALAGGFWPGVLATLLSAAAAWYLFVAPVLGFEFASKEAVSLLLFVLTSGINVVVVALLNSAIDRILAQEQNVRVLIESAPTGIIVVDEQGVIRLVNGSVEKQFGYGRRDLLGKRVEMLVPIETVDAHEALRAAFLHNPEARSMGAGRDLHGRRKDGSEFEIEIGLNPISQSGRTRVLATVIDISERKKAEDRQRFLIRELHHRSQNLFAVIQAIAARSLVEGQTLAEAKEVLNGRLAALARTHAMLADAAWEGASLNEIVTQELSGFSKYVSLSGCDIVVNTPAAQSFALIVHELATNAVKYGALSSPNGRVVIEGSIERANGGGQFWFRWKESGGPPVVIPTRKGFGSAILLDAAKQFGQHVAVDYDPDGLTYELRISLGAMEAAGKGETAPIGRFRRV
jgi:PAS domain S-box-containing protein